MKQNIETLKDGKSNKNEIEQLNKIQEMIIK